jgi:Protein of unknown function DUF2620
MKRIAIGGQLDRESIAQKISVLAGDGLSVEIKSDIEAAMAVKNGLADYYIGACNTGCGGALAMAIALIGQPACVSLSMPGNIKSPAEIAAEVASGKCAFGFTAEHADLILPPLIAQLLQ